MRFKYISTIIILIIFIIPSHVNAKGVHAWNWKIGEATEPGAWIQGMWTDDANDQIYFYDGTKIKRGKGGQAYEYFDMMKVAPLLKEYGLDTKDSIESIILGRMEMNKGAMYISGLMFSEEWNTDKMWQNRPLFGLTYTVLFKIVKGTPYLMHISEAKHHIQTGGRFAEDTREDPRLDDFFFHFEKVTVPRFSFHGDKVILSRHRDTETEEFAEIIQVGTKTKTLFSMKLSPDLSSSIHLLGHIIGDKLYAYHNMSYHIKSLSSGKLTLYKLEDNLMRPHIRGDKLYFLNDKGFGQLHNGKVNYLFTPDQIITKNDLHIEIHYVDYNIERNVLYLTDFNRPRTFWSFDLN
ncbi:hypothetical protein P9265_16730 [Schinkia azotoformans]|uniref:hypothetical protein n=1 Tax=Schinkia azotoformans TaxID=1454 RepID=UPI002E21BA49|nr:hypothetical protein [Schinkia azotoformans]